MLEDDKIQTLKIKAQTDGKWYNSNPLNSLLKKSLEDSISLLNYWRICTKDVNHKRY